MLTGKQNSAEELQIINNQKQRQKCRMIQIDLEINAHKNSQRCHKKVESGQLNKIINDG